MKEAALKELEEKEIEDKKAKGATRREFLREVGSLNNSIYQDETGQEFYTSTIFVGDLSENVTERDLEECFCAYGSIETARIINGKPYGFVKFSAAEDAKSAISAMNGHLLCGTPVRVSPAKVPSQNKTPLRRSTDRFQESEERSPPPAPPVVPVEQEYFEKVAEQEEEYFEHQQYYGHLGADNLIQTRGLVTYDDV